jgi:hypothetical protein
MASRDFLIPPGPVTVASRTSAAAKFFAVTNFIATDKRGDRHRQICGRASGRPICRSESRSRIAGSRAKSLVEKYRFSGSLAKHRSTTQQNGGGISGFTALIVQLILHDCKKSLGFRFLWNARFPVAIS